MQKQDDKDQKVITLICDDCHCCPEVIVGQDEVVIRDDFGGKIKFTKEQFNLFKEKIKREEL